LDKKQLERFRDLLLVERRRVLRELGDFEDNYVGKTPRDASGVSSAYSMHPAEMGTDSNEMEKAYIVGAASGAVLEDIDDALRKVDKGLFGKCERCAAEIPSERLEAVPYAKYCLACRAEIEKTGETST
jgi:DnaK suppressor protein